MKRLLVLGLVLMLVSVMGLVACGGEEAATTTAAPTTATSEGPTTTAVASGETTVTTTGEFATTSAYPEGKWKFSFNQHMAATHDIARTVELWMQEITTRTNGAVQWEYLPGATLTPANKAWEGVLAGIGDFAWSVFTYNPGLFPVFELLDMPQGYPNGFVATMVANDFYNEFQPVELEGVKILGLYSTGPQILGTVKKPVRALEDLKGLVLRSTGVGAKVASSLGAEGYAAAQNEAYELMSKGVVDGTIAPIEVLRNWKQAEVVKYVTRTPAVGSVSVMYNAMNKDKWEELPGDVQQIFLEVTEEFIPYWAGLSYVTDVRAIEFTLAQPGREVIDLTDDEAARWKTAVRPMIDDKLAALKAAAHTQDFEGFIRARIEYWLQNMPSPEQMTSWVEQNVPDVKK